MVFSKSPSAFRVGFGVVTEIDEQGANKKAKVDFEQAGEKTLLLSFAKLRILDK
ncbi:MAG: hypothetical protein RLN88_03190 [Ekhidna sp.]|uniref:hypothetical protein n=1 Tax=Ekhidna sp. TaxID=2608089 RepID=UPI0032ED4FA5